jgi:ankyrin repeat protein
MGACCSSTNSQQKSTQQQIQEKRKSKINPDEARIDTNMNDSNASANKLHKTSTTTCLISGDIVKLEEILQSQNIDVNDYNNTNKNFFHDALIKSNKVEVIEMLINKKRADINLPEQQTGNTPIFLAAIDLKVDFVKLLIKHNPNIYHLNEEKQNVIDFLREWNNELIEGAKRRSSLKRGLSEEEKENFDEILNLLEDYKKSHPIDETSGLNRQ